eukprot:gene12931-14170_t
MLNNVEILVPIIAIFILVQSRKSFSLSVPLLNGLRLFVIKHFQNVPKLAPKKSSDNDKEDEIPVEQLFTESDISMTEIDATKPESIESIKSQYYHSFLEIILYFAILAIFSHLTSSITQSLLALPASESFNWTWFVLVCTLLFSFQSQLLLLLGNGWKEGEVQLAFTIGLIFFLVTSALSFFFRFSSFTSLTLSHIILHAKAMLMQFSSTVPIPSDALFALIIRVLINGGLALLAVTLALPALRFTLTFHKMTLGRSFEKVGQPWTTICSLEFVLPFFIVILFSPGLNHIVAMQLNTATSEALCHTSESEPQTCSADSSFITHSAIPLRASLKPALRTALSSQRTCLTFKKHMQSFLDFSIETSALVVMVPDISLKQNLLTIVMLRGRYLVALAFEFVSFPIQILCLLILLFRNVPIGLGISAAIHSLLRWDTTPLVRDTVSLLSQNTTAAAIEQASKPYLFDAVCRFMGIVVLPEGVTAQEWKTIKDQFPVEKTSVFLTQFYYKLSRVYYLPPKVSLICFQELFFNIFLIWSLISMISFLIWIMNPDALKKKISSPK